MFAREQSWHKIGVGLTLTGTEQALKNGKISFIIMSSSSNSGKVEIIYHETFKVFCKRRDLSENHSQRPYAHQALMTPLKIAEASNSRFKRRFDTNKAGHIWRCPKAPHQVVGRMLMWYYTNSTFYNRRNF